MSDAKPWPTELTFKSADKFLDVAFDDGVRFQLPYELLRVESPSAEVQGHGGDHKVIVPGKRDVGVTGAQTTGNYAVRIQFDDGHSTGIFSWNYLYELGQRQDALMATYLDALESRGLSREH